MKPDQTRSRREEPFDRTVRQYLSTRGDISVKTYSVSLDATGVQLAVVVARFNHLVSTRLLEGCRETFEQLGGRLDDFHVAWVPGAFEIPQAARTLAQSGRYDAIVTLGSVIRGGTPHFDYVAGEASSGLGTVAREIDTPLLFGVLTTDTADQAWARASREEGNKGSELARSALHMIGLYEGLEGS
jgi:6,7-dimethyl-8-ribityllumazine synthase